MQGELSTDVNLDQTTSSAPSSTQGAMADLWHHSAMILNAGVALRRMAPHLSTAAGRSARASARAMIITNRWISLPTAASLSRLVGPKRLEHTMLQQHRAALRA